MAGLANGLYRLDYPANDGTGAILSSLVALNGDVLIGSDLHGAMLSGELRYDPGRGTSRVKLRIGMPPDGELVTGLKAADAGGAVEVEAELSPASNARIVLADVAGRPLAVELHYVGPLPGVRVEAQKIARARSDRHERTSPHPLGGHNRRTRAAR